MNEKCLEMSGNFREKVRENLEKSGNFALNNHWEPCYDTLFHQLSI